MIWLYILIFIPFITATKQRDETSYRSNGMPGNKQILILYTKAKDHSEFDSGKDRQSWVKRRSVARSIMDFINYMKSFKTPNPWGLGQKKKKHHQARRVFSWVKKLLNHPPENPLSRPQPLRDKVPNGFNKDDKPVLRMPSEDNDDLDSKLSLRTKKKQTKHKNKKREEKIQKLRERAQPRWVSDLKDYTKDLANNYGYEEVRQFMKPVIRSIEKKHHVKVKDVDVDEYGEIHVTYNDKKKNKKKHSARQGNLVDET